MQLRPLPARLLRSAAPLPLAPWAHAVGASSVTRSVCVSTDSADGSPGDIPLTKVFFSQKGGKDNIIPDLTDPPSFQREFCMQREVVPGRDS